MTDYEKISIMDEKTKELKNKLQVTRSFLKAKLTGEFQNVMLNHNQTMINNVKEMTTKRVDLFMDNLLNDLYMEEEDRRYWKIRYYNV